MNLAELFKKDSVKKDTKSVKTVEKDGVLYKFCKNKKSKQIKITIREKNLVLVSIPFYAPYKSAEFFVKQKEDWIKSKLEKFSFNSIEENFQTRTNNLLISTGLVQTPVTKKTGNLIQFIYPIGADFYSNEIQNEAKKALKKALYIEAKDYLPKRIEQLACEFGFKYGKLAFKTHKTRWGSCSYRNNINLNINLMLFDDEIIDYVLIHELCHTVEKNHGERFWALVQKCMPNAFEARKRLKKKISIV